MASSPTIVLAEDEPDLRELIQYTLEGDGFSVEAFDAGDDCWERLRTGERPDLVMLDIMLPGMDGIDMLERVRADESLADIPVVFLTGRGREEDVDAAVDDYIMKPFSPKELRERLRQLL